MTEWQPTMEPLEVLKNKCHLSAHCIGAKSLGGGVWAHRNESTGRWVLVTFFDMVNLYDYLCRVAGLPQDRYLAWLDATAHEVMPEGWSPEIIPSPHPGNLEIR